MAQDIGEKEDIDMNKSKITYTDAPEDISETIAAGEIIADFLPPPEKLLRKKSKVKITITLNKDSVEFFKKYAQTNHVKYQTMINEVLDTYVQRYS